MLISSLLLVGTSMSVRLLTSADTTVEPNRNLISYKNQILASRAGAFGQSKSVDGEDLFVVIDPHETSGQRTTVILNRDPRIDVEGVLKARAAQQRVRLVEIEPNTFLVIDPTTS